jgi:hypothetical protein
MSHVSAACRLTDDQKKWGRMTRVILTVLAVLSSTSLHAVRSDQSQPQGGWRLILDNDILTGQATDRDYTGGIGLTYTGDAARDNLASLDPLRESLTASLHSLFSDDVPSRRYHSQQIGLMLFTPEDITSTQPVYDDRPYASMLFVSNSALDIAPAGDSIFISRLTIGMLGLSLAADIQRVLHEVTDSDVPSGWEHQVSAGGEPALMVELARQHALFLGEHHEWKAGWDAVIGSITELDASISWRAGHLRSPWWSHVPTQVRYVEQSMPVIRSAATEWFVYAGAKLRLVGYNALLQGQFRESEVSIPSDDIERLVAEYSSGAAYAFADHYRIDVYFRGNTPEFRGSNRRSAHWAGMSFSYSW